jgi:hypothetical protein
MCADTAAAAPAPDPIIEDQQVISLTERRLTAHRELRADTRALPSVAASMAGWWSGTPRAARGGLSGPPDCDARGGFLFRRSEEFAPEHRGTVALKPNSSCGCSRRPRKSPMRSPSQQEGQVSRLGLSTRSLASRRAPRGGQKPGSPD